MSSMQESAVLPKSVHLENYFDSSVIPADIETMNKMDYVIDICSSALFLRKEAGLKVRIPLNAITIYSKADHDLSRFIDIIKDEINVKNVLFSNNVASVVNDVAKIDLKKCGKKFGKDLKSAVANINDKKYTITGKGNDRVLTIEGFDDKPLAADEFFLQILPCDVKTTKVCGKDDEHAVKDMAIVLDINVTKSLYEEGIVRDIVRLIQDKRKSMDLNIADRIKLDISCGAIIHDILTREEYQEYVKKETLTVDMIVKPCASAISAEEKIILDYMQIKAIEKAVTEKISSIMRLIG